MSIVYEVCTQTVFKRTLPSQIWPTRNFSFFRKVQGKTYIVYKGFRTEFFVWNYTVRIKTCNKECLWRLVTHNESSYSIVRIQSCFFIHVLIYTNFFFRGRVCGFFSRSGWGTNCLFFWLQCGNRWVFCSQWFLLLEMVSHPSFIILIQIKILIFLCFNRNVYKLHI